MQSFDVKRSNIVPERKHGADALSRTKRRQEDTDHHRQPVIAQRVVAAGSPLLNIQQAITTEERSRWERRVARREPTRPLARTNCSQGVNSN
eukprot:scaffold7020_cov141-Skeletonema_marinoi.AAC.8